MDDEDGTAGLSEVQHDATSPDPLNDVEETFMKTMTTLLTRPFPGISTLITASALCLSSLVPAAADADEVLYRPIQSITHAFGSKFMNGYFEQAGGACIVTFMLTEQSEPERMRPDSPMRLRLVL